MPSPPLFTHDHFPRIKEAREALKAKAPAMVDILEKVIQKAVEAGEHEVAIKAIQWMIEHAPDHDGERMINRSVDSKEIDSKSKGPQISIGIALLDKPALPPAPKAIESNPVEIIDVTNDNSDPTKS